MTKNTLLIIIAYLLMMIIWSTTPLAIKWSSQGVSFITGVSLRMLIGAALATILSLIWYRSIPMHKSARQVYLASACAIYGAMMMVYWGVMGSVAGFVSYYYVLAKLSPSTVALATLITPVSALLLGTWFNHEIITVSIFSGTACIMSGLIIHQFYDILKQKIVHKT